MLLRIFDKELALIPDSVKNIVFEKWASPKPVKKYDYTLMYELAGGMIFLLFILLLRYKVMAKYNKKLEREIEKTKQELEEKQKQLIQQSRQAQMGEMISMIAHQWRQPLAAISATSVAMQLQAELNQLDDATVVTLSKKISQYSKHLSETIDDFRNFFKPNKEKKKTDYTQLVQSVLGIIETSLKNQNIAVEKELSCDDRFFTYPNEITQVILNLMKNAEDALLEKKIKNPVIKIKSFNENGRSVLEISDNAGGIPEEIMSKIFDPYFSTKSKKTGTGLGLYMSKTIIEEHCEGKLNVKNDNFGASFSIELTDSLVKKSDDKG